MDSKTIAIVVVFAALTIVLDISPIKVPAPFAPYLIYQVWEIPIVAATLLFGLPVGVGIALTNTIVLLGYYPGELPTGPFYNLIAVLSMILGIYITQKFVGKRFNRRQQIFLISLATTMGIIIRVGVMTVVNWTFLRYPPPIGFNIPVEGLTAMLPIIGFFNATLALYTIPVGYILARIVRFSSNVYTLKSDEILDAS